VLRCGLLPALSDQYVTRKKKGHPLTFYIRSADFDEADPNRLISVGFTNQLAYFRSSPAIYDSVWVAAQPLTGFPRDAGTFMISVGGQNR